jgi:hypothetical protein
MFSSHIDLILYFCVSCTVPLLGHLFQAWVAGDNPPRQRAMSGTGEPVIQCPAPNSELEIDVRHR